MCRLERLDFDSGRLFFGSFFRRLLLHQVPRGRRQAGLRPLHRVARRLLHSATHLSFRLIFQNKSVKAFVKVFFCNSNLSISICQIFQLNLSIFNTSFNISQNFQPIYVGCTNLSYLSI